MTVAYEMRFFVDASQWPFHGEFGSVSQLAVFGLLGAALWKVNCRVFWHMSFACASWYSHQRSAAAFSCELFAACYSHVNPQILNYNMSECIFPC